MDPNAQRLAIMKAWTNRARNYWSILKSRVKAVAFVDPCPMFTDLPKRGVGFGLVPVGVPNAAEYCSPTGDVTLLREWFKMVRIPLTHKIP